MSAPYIIEGAATHGEVFPRLDIYDLKERFPEQFTLFVLAWEEIMKEDFRPTAANFQQIAGIHGMPYLPWPGDPDQTLQTVRGAWLGYCNHASILFPNWHRPYLMLLEQIISDVAYGIAGKFAATPGMPPEQAEKWKKAARELRFPFWDWTHHRTEAEGFPGFLTTPEIDLFMQDGEMHRHNNILAFFQLNHPVDGFNNRLMSNRFFPGPAIAYFKEWTRTYRHPNSSPVGVTENYGAMNARLQSGEGAGSWANLTRAVAQMFVFPVNIPPEKRANAWDEFSNTTFQSGHRDFLDRKRINSPHYWKAVPIEQPHNDVHVVVGGLGHMIDNDTAGFDPIFFLHHCNVDRLLAFWEHVYPEYVAGTEGFLEADSKSRVPFTQSGGTFIEINDQVVDSNSPLMPFRKPGYTYWDSRDTHSLKHDGENRPPNNKYYTYLPIGSVDLRNPVGTLQERETQRASLQRYFQYNPIEAIENSGVSMEQHLFAGVAPYAGTTPRPSGRKYVPKFRQFVIAVSLDPSYIDGSYQLVVQAESNQRRHEVGVVSVLGRGKSATCGNCQAQRAVGARVHGIIVVPHTVIATVLGFLGYNTAGTSDGQVLQAIKMSLRPALVLPDGKLLGTLSGETPDDRRLPEDKAPALNLMSSDVYQSETQEDQENQAFEFDDWMDHGPVEIVEAVDDTLGPARRHWVEVAE